MKLEVHIDPALAEARVEVYAPARTPEVDALLGRLTAAEAPLLGFRDDGSAVQLEPEDVLRSYGEDKDVRGRSILSGSGCRNWSGGWQAVPSPGCPTRKL